jgi:hypothetical protein
MLGTLEKILWGLSGLLLVGIAVAIVFLGLPSTTPPIAMASKTMTAEELQARLKPEQKALLDAELRGFELDADGKPVPRSDGNRPAQKTVVQVNKELFQRLGNLNDCIHEMEFAQSEALDDGSLKIFAIQEGSLLEKVGLKDNDILEGVGGAKLDFRDISKCKGVWEESLERLEAGSPVVVEIKRRGARHQLVVAPGF